MLYEYNINLNKLVKILNIDTINEFIKDMSQKDKLVLGDSIVSIIVEKSNIFQLNKITKNEKSEVIVYIKPEYLHKLAISSINITQLPKLNLGKLI